MSDSEHNRQSAQTHCTLCFHGNCRFKSSHDVQPVFKEKRSAKLWTNLTEHKEWVVIFPKDAPGYDIIPTAGSPFGILFILPYYSFKAMRVIYIFGSPLRSIDPSPSLPKSSDLAFRGYNLYFTDGRIKSPRDGRVRPWALDVGTQTPAWASVASSWCLH